MKLSELVEKYIALRNKKRELKSAYEEQVAGIDGTLDKIEAKLLQVFDQTGMESVRTDFGTAYKSTRSSASVADRDLFMDHVKRHGDWQLLEVRCSKQAVEQFKDVNGDLPPGVNLRSEIVINVRST
jgi:hypothetical protein